jgi:cobalt-zinc-cadmium efflux system protein
MAHDHDHGDGDGHGHEAPVDFGRAFIIGIGIQTAFIALEVVYGLLAHSLALLADAGHNVSDVLSLALAWSASSLAKKKPSKTRTYGLRRLSILAALFNALSLMFVTGGVAWESVRRLLAPGATVGGRTVIVVAALGIVVNGVAAWLFRAGRKGDLNINAAFLHLASDAVISLGVALAGVAILFTGWMWLDPLVSLVLSIVVLATTWSLLRRAVNLALDAVPEGIELDDVETFLRSMPRVVDVHDLHVWAMSTTENLLTAHLVVSESAGDAFLGEVCDELHRRFKIGHSTLQLESTSFVDCRLAPEGTI